MLTSPPTAFMHLTSTISVLIYTIGSIALGIIGLATLGIGFLLAIPVVIIALIVWLVLVIQGGLAASRGEQFRYPTTIDFVKLELSQRRIPRTYGLQAQPCWSRITAATPGWSRD